MSTEANQLLNDFMLSKCLLQDRALASTSRILEPTKLNVVTVCKAQLNTNHLSYRLVNRHRTVMEVKVLVNSLISKEGVTIV